MTPCPFSGSPVRPTENTLSLDDMGGYTAVSLAVAVVDRNPCFQVYVYRCVRLEPSYTVRPAKMLGRRISTMSGVLF